MPRFERPQKKNPHGLAIYQHCFPSQSIDRFADESGFVDVKRVGLNKAFKAKSSNRIFCVQRAWDHRSETGFMKDIEDDFQRIAKNIIAGSKTEFSDKENRKITEMYTLWNVRWYWGRQPIQDQEVSGVSGVTRELSKDDLEYLEKGGVIGIRPDLIISGRHFTGSKILQNIDVACEKMEGSKWGILKSTCAEFIVPDNSPEFAALPLTPNICLFANHCNAVVSDVFLSRINQSFIDNSSDYYFARDFRL